MYTYSSITEIVLVLFTRLADSEVMVKNVNAGVIQLHPCPSLGKVPSREEVNCFQISIRGEKIGEQS